jgi:hypothetical protein
MAEKYDKILKQSDGALSLTSRSVVITTTSKVQFLVSRDRL